MKKFSVAICLILTLILCLPSLSVSADSVVTEGFFTSDSVSNYFTGSYVGSNSSFSRLTGSDDFYKISNNEISAADIAAFNSLEVTNVNDPNYCSFLVRDGSNWYYYLMQFNTTQNLIVYNNGTFIFISPYGVDYNQLIAYRYYVYQNGSWSAPAGLNSTVYNNQYRYFQIPQNSASQTLSLMYVHNINFVSDIGEYLANSGSSSGVARFVDIWQDVYSNNNVSGYTNYCPSDLPFWNGSSVVDPSGSPVETNLNHLYLTNFDSGFCKPYHMEDLWRAGGGYMYLKYNFDSWVNSHISDYNLQIITQLDVDGTTTTYPSVRNLDAQGISVFSFGEMASSFNWGNENMLFLEYPDSLFGNYKIGYVYSLSSNQYIQTHFGARYIADGNANKRLFYSNGSSTRRLTGSETDSDIQSTFLGSTHSEFKISIIVRLVDVSTSEVSGSYVETFDLISGVSTVSNDQIRDNTNPYVSDDSVYLPVDNSDGGYLVQGSRDMVNVYNMTPSQIKLVIDNGLEQFITWYNSDPSVTEVSTGFWSSFGIFRNNPAIDLYEDYFGFLPTGFKDIILGCATIGIVGGVFAALRRKFT